jgi:hypothetical protein
VLTFRLTLVPAIAVAVEGSTTKLKSWVGRTMKWPVEVEVPPEVVIAMGPVVAPTGTVVVTVVVLGTEKPETVVLLKLTEERPPNFVPVMVTDVPTLPQVGSNLLRVGGGCFTERKLAAGR